MARAAGDWVETAVGESGPAQRRFEPDYVGSRAPTLLRALDAAQGKALVTLPHTGVSPVTDVRSTLLSSSLEMVRKRGLFDRYAAALPAEYHESVIRTLGPTWLPLEMADAHYRALQALELSEHEVLSIGRVVGDRLQGTFLGTIARTAKQAGMTPWALASKLDVIWGRVFRGGGLAVWKLGPKDARIEVRGLSLMEIPYFRTAWRGVLSAGIESFSRKSYVRDCSQARHPDGFDVVVFWA